MCVHFLRTRSDSFSVGCCSCIMVVANRTPGPIAACAGGTSAPSVNLNPSVERITTDPYKRWLHQGVRPTAGAITLYKAQGSRQNTMGVRMHENRFYGFERPWLVPFVEWAVLAKVLPFGALPSPCMTVSLGTSHTCEYTRLRMDQSVFS
jgi:hypothetical protein